LSTLGFFLNPIPLSFSHRSISSRIELADGAWPFTCPFVWLCTTYFIFGRPGEWNHGTLPARPGCLYWLARRSHRPTQLSSSMNRAKDCRLQIDCASHCRKFIGSTLA
jgi:hypothetical protein